MHDVNRLEQTPASTVTRVTAVTGNVAEDGKLETLLSQVNMNKFLVMAVNKDINEVGLAKPLTIKDLDCLDQDTFVKIIIYLITSNGLYTVDQILGKREVLLRLKDAGLPMIEYDGTLDHLYYATKAFFPDGDESFTYSMLLKPQSYPKMVKTVLNYLAKFTVFSENCAEALADINVRVAEEFTKKNDLHQQIDDVNAKITERVNRLEEKRAGLPGMQQDLNVKNVELAKEEDVLGELEKELARYKKIYEAEGQEKLRMERTLEEALQHRGRLEAKLVSNPEVIQLQHKYETEKLQELIQERETVGQLLDRVTTEDQWVDELVKKGAALLARVEDSNSAMIEIAGMFHEQKGIDDALLNFEINLKAVTTHFKHLAVTKEKAITENEVDVKSLTASLSKMEAELDTVINKIGTLKGNYVDNEHMKTEMENRLGNFYIGMEEKEEQIVKNEAWIRKEVTAELIQTAAQLNTLLESFNQDLFQAELEYSKPI